MKGGGMGKRDGPGSTGATGRDEGPGVITRGTKMSLKTRHEVLQRATSGEHEKKPRWIAMPLLPEVQGPVARPVTLGVTHTRSKADEAVQCQQYSKQCRVLAVRRVMVTPGALASPWLCCLFSQFPVVSSPIPHCPREKAVPVPGTACLASLPAS